MEESKGLLDCPLGRKWLYLRFDGTVSFALAATFFGFQLSKDIPLA